MKHTHHHARFKRGFIFESISTLVVVVVMTLLVVGGVIAFMYYNAGHITATNVMHDSSSTQQPQQKADVSDAQRELLKNITSARDVGATAGTMDSDQMSTGNATKGTLRDLFSFEKNVQCTVAATINGISVVGARAYISKGMVRIDARYSSKEGVPAQDAHFIKNADTAYAWMGSQGVQVDFNKLVALADKNASANTTSSVNIKNTQTKTSTSAMTSINFDQQADYSCTDWNVDTTKFVVPANVRFIDLSKYI